MAMAQTARSAAQLLRLSSPPLRTSSAAQLSSSRTFSADAHGHGPARVPMWEDPMSPSRWKEEHFVLLSLAGWGLLFYGSYKFFTSGSSKEVKKVVHQATTPAH